MISDEKRVREMAVEKDEKSFPALVSPGGFGLAYRVRLIFYSNSTYFIYLTL
jgi:hypothetical protein